MVNPKVKTTLLVSVLLVTAVIAIFFIVAANRQPELEKFTTSSEQGLTDSAQAAQRNYRGMERCDALYSLDPGIGEKEFTAMSAMIGGHRIKRWKAHDSDPMNANIKPGKEYCYIYNDAENSVKDFLMVGKKCSMSNPLLNDTNGIITDVFKTNYRDVAHLVPVEKCVFEIDPNALTACNLNYIWKSWGESDCKQILTDMREDISITKNQQATVAQDHNSLWDRYLGSSNEVKRRQGSLLRCNTSNQNWAQDWTELMKNFTWTARTLGDEQLSFNQKTLDWNSLRFAHASNLKQDGVTHSNYERMVKLHGKCSKETTVCEQDYETNMFNWNTMQQQNNHLRERNLVVEEETPVTRIRVADMRSTVETCSNNVRQTTHDFNRYSNEYTDNKGRYEGCVPERDNYHRLYNASLLSGETESNNWYTCLDMVGKLRAKIELQKPKLARCNNSNNVLSQIIGAEQVTYQKVVADRNLVLEEMAKTFTTWKDCETTVGRQAATIAELEYRKSIMSQLLSDALENRNNMENTSLGKQVDINIASAQQTLQESLKNIAAGYDNATEFACGGDMDASVNDLKKDVAVFEKEIDAIKEKIKNSPCADACSISVDRCMPFKNDNKLCWWEGPL